MKTKLLVFFFFRAELCRHDCCQLVLYLPLRPWTHASSTSFTLFLLFWLSAHSTGAFYLRKTDLCFPETLFKTIYERQVYVYSTALYTLFFTIVFELTHDTFDMTSLRCLEMFCFLYLV